MKKKLLQKLLLSVPIIALLSSFPCVCMQNNALWTETDAYNAMNAVLTCRMMRPESADADEQAKKMHTWAAEVNGGAVEIPARDWRISPEHFGLMCGDENPKDPTRDDQTGPNVLFEEKRSREPVLLIGPILHCSACVKLKHELREFGYRRNEVRFRSDGRVHVGLVTIAHDRVRWWGGPDATSLTHSLTLANNLLARAAQHIVDKIKDGISRELGHTQERQASVIEWVDTSHINTRFLNPKPTSRDLREAALSVGQVMREFKGWTALEIVADITMINARRRQRE